MASLEFEREFEPQHGELVSLTPSLARVTCANVGPLTFQGTNSFLIGRDAVVVVDPGPEDQVHLDALLRGIDGRPVSAILVSHTHVDHSPLSRTLERITGAPIIGCAPHTRAPAFVDMPENPMEASADYAYVPARILADGERIRLAGRDIVAVATPGHTMNHLSFLIEDDNVLLCGDHVMGWSSSVVAPPDGSMGSYMASLEKLAAYADRFRFFPAHGGEIHSPQTYLRGLYAHRKAREAAVLAQLLGGKASIAQMTAEIYKDVDRALHSAAALNVLAHLEDLCNRGLATCEGPHSLETCYQPVKA
ncbi:MBL fold metallo-hydrolase [Polycladidibacter hongkongensis]|uniref:MBL fold metallo-hydrolase n=1 Tax=Polycladidibacter hongkongensis TaxID=1647556 RepID=UPI00082F3498|nr:MBL fold metallo-hydrolase [Pseudovibrio hongkongensis]